MQPRRKYDLLASEVTEGGQANAGDAGSEAGHGATGDQEGTETKEEGDETLQRALPAYGHNRREDKARGPPKSLRVINTCGRQGGEGGGGTPHSAACAHDAQQGQGGDPRTQQRETPLCSQDQAEEGTPIPNSARNLRTGKRGRETGCAHSPRAAQGWKKGGPPPEQQRAPPAHGMTTREGGDTPNKEAEEGAPPEQRVSAHSIQGSPPP